jgi:hypothetical protein
VCGRGGRLFSPLLSATRPRSQLPTSSTTPLIAKLPTTHLKISRGPIPSGHLEISQEDTVYIASCVFFSARVLTKRIPVCQFA